MNYFINEKKKFTGSMGWLANGLSGATPGCRREDDVMSVVAVPKSGGPVSGQPDCSTPVGNGASGLTVGCTKCAGRPQCFHGGWCGAKGGIATPEAPPPPPALLSWWWYWWIGWYPEDEAAYDGDGPLPLGTSGGVSESGDKSGRFALPEIRLKTCNQTMRLFQVSLW